VNAPLDDRKAANTPLIAVIDDEASVRKALGRLLRAAGFESRPFASGVEFLEACRHEPPDCAVLDMHMPELCGLDVLRRMNDTGLFLPMVLITADDESPRCQRMLDEGAVAWLRKPVDGPQLIQRVEQAVLTARSVHAMNARLTAFAAR
jgi:FixJ family two-component response regulator